MTLQASKILKQLKKCQFHENDMIYIDFNNRVFKTVLTSAYNDKKSKEKKYKIEKNNLIFILRELDKEEYITSATPSSYTYLDEIALRDNYNDTYILLTHKGNHVFQVKLIKFLEFLTKSIIVPIVVSILTTYVIYLLNQWQIL